MVDLAPGPQAHAVGMLVGPCLAVFVGVDRMAPRDLEIVRSELPLLGALLRAESELQLRVSEAESAAEATLRAHALARNVDAARATSSELARRLELEHRRKDEFIAILAHELRNPLAPIANAIELLRRMQVMPREPLDRLVGVMSRQMNHMRRLLDDLLDVARIAQGKVTLRKARFPLSEAIEAAAETARPLIEEKGHRLEVRSAEFDPRIEGDITRIAQVLGNLLLNAAKYSEAGGRITVSVEPADSFVAIRVEDTGVGMSPQELDTVFGLFSQVEGSLSEARGGLGVGLALARSLVELHGGTLAAHSAGPGCGSTFTVTLPRLVDAAEPLSPRTHMEPAAHSGAR